ncbi:MAG: DUF1232 domain-containing protein [Planctomycetota bacterium]
MLLRKLKARAEQLQAEAYALYLAFHDPRTPWYARAWAALVAAYALSPIDLIPDFIPVIGLLDDIILVPLGVIIAVKLIPAPVMADCRARARAAVAKGLPAARIAAVVIVAIWIGLLVVAAWWGIDWWRNR